MEQNDNKNTNIIDNNIICENIECFASTADLLRPKKRTKIEDLSTITLGYINDKSPEKNSQNQRLRVLFDSGCSSTMINKKFVKHWKKKHVASKQKEAVTLNSHSQHSMKIGRFAATRTLMNQTKNYAIMT